MIFIIQFIYLETRFPEMVAFVSGDIVTTHHSSAPLHSGEGYLFHV